MKIRMLKTVDIPNGIFFKNSVFCSNCRSKEKRSEFETLYTLFVKAGYAEEIKELENNFKFDYNQINDFIPCKFCTNGNTFDDCANCKYYRNLQDEDKMQLKSIKEINHKIINLIKSL
jgi:hypothetical protein